MASVIAPASDDTVLDYLASQSHWKLDDWIEWWRQESPLPLFGSRGFKKPESAVSAFRLLGRVNEDSRHAADRETRGV